MEQYGWMGTNSLNHSEHMLWILTILKCSHNGIICNPYGFPGGSVGKEPACQCRRHKRHGFNPWVRKIPWWRKWQPFPVFLPGKFHRQRSQTGYSQWGHKELDMTERAHTHTHTHTCNPYKEEVVLLEANVSWIKSRLWNQMFDLVQILAPAPASCVIFFNFSLLNFLPIK